MVRIVFLVLVFVSCACAQPVAPAERKSAEAKDSALFQKHGEVVITTDAGPLRYSVELAITNKEREHGLMFREHMADDAGMLFLFEKERPQSFWMKNTRIPLDMLFIASDGTIAGIVENAEPLTLSSRKVDKPSRYVLELNAGTCAKRGIRAGQRVRFESVPTELVDARVLQ